MKYKVKLNAMVTVCATATITIDAESIEHAQKTALDKLKLMETAYELEMRLYNQDPLRNDYPQNKVFWDVNSEDVENNIDTDYVEVDEVWEE